MEQNLIVTQIGVVHVDEEGYRIEVAPMYREALKGLEGFSYINILWWFSKCDHAANRKVFVEKQPYQKGPSELGVFATRSPSRPNPLALTAAYITYIDQEKGIIGLAYLDAFDLSPVLDIKPYTPSVDRVESPSVLAWCAHWPSCVETGGDFNWNDEFNF